MVVSPMVRRAAEDVVYSKIYSDCESDSDIEGSCRNIIIHFFDNIFLSVARKMFQTLAICQHFADVLFYIFFSLNQVL